MLLIAHGIVAAASAGKVAIRWTTDGPAALRHLNPAVIAALARYVLPVMARQLKRNDPTAIYERNERDLISGWDTLLTDPGFVGGVDAFEGSGPNALAVF